MTIINCFQTSSNLKLTHSSAPTNLLNLLKNNILRHFRCYVIPDLIRNPDFPAFTAVSPHWAWRGAFYILHSTLYITILLAYPEKIYLDAWRVERMNSENIAVLSRHHDNAVIPAAINPQTHEIRNIPTDITEIVDIVFRANLLISINIIFHSAPRCGAWRPVCV